MNTPANHQVIAVVGGSGAGKSWLVDQFCRIIGDKACRLSLDDFYRDRSHLPMARRARLNFDVPHAIDWSGAAKVLRDCRAGLPTAVPRYDFATYSRRPELQVWQPRPIVFVEGLWLLRTAELRPLFNFTIFLDTPTTLRHARRVARDITERGYTAEAIRHRLIATVLPMHGRYVEPQKRWADLVLSQPYRPAEVEKLADHLWPLLARVGALPCWMHETFRAELLSLLLERVEHEYAN
jgi:uridine kinase